MGEEPRGRAETQAIPGGAAENAEGLLIGIPPRAMDTAMSMKAREALANMEASQIKMAGFVACACSWATNLSMSYRCMQFTMFFRWWQDDRAKRTRGNDRRRKIFANQEGLWERTWPHVRTSRIGENGYSLHSSRFLKQICEAEARDECVR